LNNLIGISGLKGSGKDETAQMLQFCLNTPKILHRYCIYKRFNKYFKQKYKIHRFADPLKRVLATLLSVNVESFESRDFKENFYLDFNTLNIYQKHLVEASNPDLILPDNKFSKLAKDLNVNLIEGYFLSVRQVLQYVGTEVMRTFLGNRLWILATFKNPDKYKIISDVRFKVEYEEIKKRDGIVIHIQRPGCKVGTHASEKEVQEMFANKQFTYFINNTGSLQDLFRDVEQISKWI